MSTGTGWAKVPPSRTDGVTNRRHNWDRYQLLAFVSMMGVVRHCR